MPEKNNIVTTVLAIAKNREKLNLKEIEEALIKHLQDLFTEYLNDLRNWVAVETNLNTFLVIPCKSCISDLNISCIDKFDLITAGKNLGLHINVDNSSNFYFYIIKHIEGSEISVAQRMLQEFNTNLLQLISEQKKLAEDTWKSILNKLNSGKFTSKRNILDNEWIITVSNIILPKEITIYFLNELRDLLSENGLYFKDISEFGCIISIPFDE